MASVVVVGGVRYTHGMSISDEVREFARDKYVLPTRRAGRRVVAIRTGDVHKELGFNNRMPLVCSALQAEIFPNENNLVLLSRTGPRQGANVILVFELLERTPAPLRKSRDVPAAIPVPARRSSVDGRRVFLVSCVKTK